LSGQFLQGSLFAAVDAILGAIATSHTHRNVMSQPNNEQMINWGVTIYSLSPLFSQYRFFYKTRLATLFVVVL